MVKSNGDSLKNKLLEKTDELIPINNQLPGVEFWLPKYLLQVHS